MQGCRLRLVICGTVSMLALVARVAAADFDFTAPRSVSDPTVAATMRDLAERLLPVYQESDPDRYLATLSALQMVAGSYAAADVSRQSLRKRSVLKHSQRQIGRATIFDLYDEAKARATSEPNSFADSYARAYRQLAPSLSNLQALQLSAWLEASSPAEFREALQLAFDRLQKKDSISESEATQLIWSYLSFQAYREFVPLVAALEAEDRSRRYAALEDIIDTPHGGRVSLRIVRPVSAETLPSLLEFKHAIAGDDPGGAAVDFAHESAAHGYVGVVAIARTAAGRPGAKAPFELDGDDARAVVDWMAAQPWSDGRVGMYGEGVGGFVAWAVALRAPSALKAIATSGASAPGIDFPMEGNIPLNSSFEWAARDAGEPKSGSIHGRALDESWYRSGRRYRDLGRLAGSSNRAFIRWLNHPSYDRYWQKFVPYRQQFATIAIPVLTITGFYAASEPAAVYYFRQHTRYDAQADHTLLIGPYDDTTLRTNPTATVQRLRLDPSAVVDLRDLRYQWFDRVFKDGATPALLKESVNFQIAGSDEWRHAPALAAMENAKLRFYLGSTLSRTGRHVLLEQSNDKNFTEQSVNFVDRRDADWESSSDIVVDGPEVRNGVVFESAPIKHSVDLSGAFSGHLDFTVNRMDVDLAIALYERSPGGDYIRLLAPAYQFRASYARDRAHRRLLKAGERQEVDFQSERLIGRRLQAGSQLVMVLSVQKRPDQEINYGTGNDVSEESLADGRPALKLRWHGGQLHRFPRPSIAQRQYPARMKRPATQRHLIPLLTLMPAMLCVGAFSSASAASTTRKSIHEWATCDGKTDDTKNVARAFAAAKNSAFTLIVDCPVRLVFGMDYTHTIYIDNNTSIEFVGAGKFTIDNVMVPAFVLANTQNVTLTNWNVEYDAGLPINGDVGGYIKDGQFFAAGGRVQPAGAFNNFGITGWLAANRGIHFNRVTARWSGGILPMAVFLYTGDTSNVTMTGLHLYVPASAGAARFIPMAIGLGLNFRSNQTVDPHTPITAQYLSVPHDLRFVNIVFDGTYMGWLGSAQNTVFENIQSHRYADLEDADGGRNGGVLKWFAPPHLFYMNYDFKGDPGLGNSNIQIRHVVDDGPRVGSARDKGGSDSKSGYANSLKLGCMNCLVDDYTSLRLDGFMDVLPSNGLVVSNVKATYDSSFLNDQFPGWRFPSSPYQLVTFENVSITDTAAASVREPVGAANAAVDGKIVFKNVHAAIKHWASSGMPLPNINGDHNDLTMDLSIADTNSRLLLRQLNGVSLNLRATPVTVRPGGSTTLTWTSKNASQCRASGAWSGMLDPAGSRVVAVSGAASAEFTLTCDAAAGSASPTATVSVQTQ